MMNLEYFRKLLFYLRNQIFQLSLNTETRGIFVPAATKMSSDGTYVAVLS